MDDPFLTLLDHARKETTTRTKVVFCFDDGFQDSCPKIATLFEENGLRAVFAVLADPAIKEWEGVRIGDWGLWNELRKRGHFIHPHGWQHDNYRKLPFLKATADLDRCFAGFAENLEGFSPEKVCFHYPHNSGTEALDAWLLERLAAVRRIPIKKPKTERALPCNGHNDLSQVKSRILYCTDSRQFDPQSVENAKLRRPFAWIIALHGIKEGWGSLTAEALELLLTQILDEPDLECLNAI